MRTILTAICIFLPMFAYASGIGVSFSQTPDGWDVGATADVETERSEIEVAGAFGDFYDIKVDALYNVPFIGLEWGIFITNDWKGYGLTQLARTNDLGVQTVLPYRGVDIGVAIFGQNSNPVAPSGKFDPDTGDPVSEVPGLTIREGSRANVALFTECDINIFEVKLKVLTDISNEPVPQFLVDASTGGDIGKVNWVLSVDYGTQRYKGDWEHEVSTNLTFGIDF